MDTVELYTYEEWEKIHKRRAFVARRKKAKAIKRAIYQKLVGIALIAMAFITPRILDGDATASFIFLPMGIYVLLAKEDIFKED